MSKVLGFTNNGGEDWFSSSKYNTKEITGIQDPEGGKTENPPTAIPSPFARIDLVRKSFNAIAQSSSLGFYQRGSSVIASKEDERNVSRCLDLAEMLFYFETYSENLQIVEWNRELEIEKLKKSANLGHRRLGDVLAMYLRQDAKSFHFDKLNSIYIVKYNHRVIGGTSPLTLFFNVADDIGHYNLKSTKGKTFFKDVVPLYERDEEFQKYLYLLFNANPSLKDLMKDLWNYLEASLKILRSENSELFNQINTTDSNELNRAYSSLYTNTQGQCVEVFGCELKYLGSNMISTEESDFTIHSSKYLGDNKPLVLQNKFNKPFKYLKGNWTSTTVVPYQDSEPLSNRTLPGLSIKFPYLTISDFLEDSIIRLVYLIDKDSYFDGNLKMQKPDNTKSYLLPLKPFFFAFFDVKDLLSNGAGTPSLQLIEGLAESVTAVLKIPIKNGSDFIVFERTYYKEGDPDAKENKGRIQEQQVGITIFPFVEFPEELTPHYNVQLIDRNIHGLKFNIGYRLKFYNRKNQLVTKETTRIRNRKINNTSNVQTLYSELEEAFDYIQIESGEANAVILPKFKEVYRSGKEYHFAIDFGTSNTHVEYAVAGQASKALDITPEDIQAVSIIDSGRYHNFSGTRATELNSLIGQEFIPSLMGVSDNIGFPTRTVISHSNSNTPKANGLPLVDFNIPFLYERGIDAYNHHTTNLKWDNRDELSTARTNTFLEQLVLMMRNKVLMNGGVLGESKISWTYPTSMSSVKRDRLSHTFAKIIKKCFGSEVVTASLSESIAPYYYFKSTDQLAGKGFGSSVLMDIGGGTSDVTVFKNNEPILISSYRFAGNALFGTGYNEEPGAKSALAKENKAIFDEQNELYHLSQKEISDHIYATGGSAEYHNFLFSLPANLDPEYQEVFNFNKRLADNEDLKVVFLYFFAAKIYHLALLLKQNHLETPQNMVFSGNGSNILDIISFNRKSLGLFAGYIFKSVLGGDEKTLKIVLEDKYRKESTAKGAIRLSMVNKMEIEDKNLISALKIGDIKAKLTYQDLKEDKYLDIVVKDVNDFNDFFIKGLKDLDVKNIFGIPQSSIDIFKSVANQHVRNYTLASINAYEKMEGGETSSSVELLETPFFFPIVEIIQDLYKEILENENVD